MTSNAAAMRAMADGRYLSLESFRRDGRGVRTPVWFAPAPGEAEPLFYVPTSDNTFKTKRIQRNPAVRIAACDARGKVSGEWIDGRAEIAGPAAFADATRLLDRKYFPWKQMLSLLLRLRGHQRVVIVIRPTVSP